MKKFLFLPIFLGALLPAPFTRGELRVAATVTDLAAVAREVGGPRAEILHLVEGHQDPHRIQAKPSLMRALRGADALVYVGLELESGWLPLVVKGSRNPKIQPGAPGLIDASEGVRVIEKPEGPVSRAEGDVHPEGNSHYYMDPLELATVARNLARRFGDLDPPGAEDYQKRAEDFAGRLRDLHGELEHRLAPFAGTPVVTYHRNLQYFLLRYGFVPFGFVENRPGIPPSARHLEDLTARMEAENVPLVLYQPYHDEGLCRRLAERAGAVALLFPGEVGGVPGSTDTFSHFRTLAALLERALAGGGKGEK